MQKTLFILFCGTVILLLAIQAKLLDNNEQLPIFLMQDKIEQQHKANIEVYPESIYKPSTNQIQTLQNDYMAIWAHLNNVYQTNDVISGKEYYTEDWFKQLCKHYTNKIQGVIHRNDIQHKVIIKNWSSDALVCTLIDSVQLEYKIESQNSMIRNEQFAFVLLFQGDHWRIDAIKQL